MSHCHNVLLWFILTELCCVCLANTAEPIELLVGKIDLEVEVSSDRMAWQVSSAATVGSMRDARLATSSSSQ